MKFHISTAFVAALALHMHAFAQGTSEPAVRQPPQNAQSTPAMATAEVRKIDKEAGKITLKHEAILSLDMPPMTMVFRAADAKLLDVIKTGDNVRFAAEKIGGQYTVTRIEAAP